ncbi:MAG: T9SS type A sorting domain-containing protein [Flavobacteriales bacterium]|nr:T9SS type A sorting domain-containing protein [Flavobacteriales bacterium]
MLQLGGYRFGIILLVLVALVRSTVAQNISAAEYFFDTDPGVGNGTDVPVTTTPDSISFDGTASTVGLTNGFHYLYVRTRDDLWRWSLHQPRRIFVNDLKIIKAEYFYDTDPGVGNGTAVAVTATLDSISFNSSLNTTGLAHGYHLAYLRTKDNQGHWSLHQPRRIFVNDLKIVKAEYFYDTDPGVGNGTAVAVTATLDSIAFNSSLNTTGLAHGYHLVYLRTKDNQGHWSLHQPRRIFVNDLKIVKAEYFYDTDPGVGNGTAVAVTATLDSISFNSSLNTTGLAHGYHLAYLRTKDNQGHWSLHQPRRILVNDLKIVKAEYFYDTDPGVGNGTAVAVTATLDSIAFNGSLNTTGLSSGYHFAYFRTKDNQGHWSLHQPRRIYITAKVVAAEAFFDTDPGHGNGYALTPGTAADSVNWNLTATIPALSVGNHNMYVRTKDDHGVWSHYSLLQVIDVIPGPIVWTGNQSQLWNVTLNWSSSVVPTATDNALIPTVPTGGVFPNVNVANAAVSNIEIQTGATMTVTAGNAITVNGVLNNSGTVYVNDDGSLVQTVGSTLAGAGSYQVQRQGSSGQAYNFWSSPITSTAGVPGSPSYAYNSNLGTQDDSDDQPSDPGWYSYNGNMIPGSGYAGWSANMATFTGTVNNGPIAYPLTYYAFDNTYSNANPGTPINLVGNPYPSAISAADLIAANSDIDGTIFFWDDDLSGGSGYTRSDFAYWNGVGGLGSGSGAAGVPNGFISTAQGFQIRALNGSASIDFDNSMRVTGPNTQFFRTNAEEMRLWFGIHGNDLHNQVLIGVMEDATDGEDRLYDAIKLRGNANISLSAIGNGTEHAIMAFPQPIETKTIPLSVHVGVGGSYAFRADSLISDGVLQVYFRDELLGTSDLMEQGDSVVRVLASGQYNDRFYLDLSSTITSVEEEQASFHLHIANGRGYLDIKRQVDCPVQVTIFDMGGRIVFGTAVEMNAGSGSFAIPQLSQGAYIMRANDCSQQLSKRFVLF